MFTRKLKANKGMRVKTESGLDIRLFNEGLEIQLERMPFGMSVELVDSSRTSGATAPSSAYYIVNFYKPETVTGALGKVNEVKSMLGGAVYLTKEGVIIRGSKTSPKDDKESIIDYRDRI